jgi:hypothetical protein
MDMETEIVGDEGMNAMHERLQRVRALQFFLECSISSESRRELEEELASEEIRFASESHGIIGRLHHW